MGHLTVLCVLLLASLGCQVVAEREVIQQGGVYQLKCWLTVRDDNRYITQFFRDKAEVTMFNSTLSSTTFYIISKDTTVNEETTNSTDRYTVDQVNGLYLLTIKDLIDSDSGWYGCRRYDTELNRTSLTQVSTELFVPGPLIGLLWTADVHKLHKDEIPDGGISLTKPKHPNIGCLVDVSNVEPEVSITIGRYGAPDAVDITHQYRKWVGSTLNRVSGGLQFRSTVTFERVWEFSQRSIRNVYCRASANGTIFEKSVNIQVRSKPDDKPCSPNDFHASVGAKDVNLTCLIEAHPAADVVWTTTDGASVTELSNNGNYTVTNSERFEGLFTTLTIAKVADKTMYGRYIITANNTEGTGTKELTFKIGVAGITRSSVSLITSMMCLLTWLLK